MTLHGPGKVLTSEDHLPRKTLREAMRSQAQPWHQALMKGCFTLLLPSLRFTLLTSSRPRHRTITLNLLKLTQVISQATVRHCCIWKEHGGRWICLVHILASLLFTVGIWSSHNLYSLSFPIWKWGWN